MIIQKRLESNFSEYRKKGSFIDCKISFEDHEISAHRIILSKFSKFFLNLFVNSEEKFYTFKPNYNPQNMLEKVIDFFYENTIDKKILETNLIAFLAISRYYQIGILEELVTDLLPERINRDTALGFCQKCVEFKIQDQAKYFTPIIAENWKFYRRDKIFKNVDPYVLSLILLDKHMDDVNQKAKIQIIDEFYESYDSPITDSEREKLTNVIDWTVDNSYQYLTRYDFKCEWIDPRIIRPLLKRINKVRRPAYSKLRDKLENTNIENSGESSKLFLLTQMINIKQANPESEDGTLIVPVVNYLSTYGDLMEGYDAVLTGAISVSSSPPMSKDIKVNYALGVDPEQPFISVGKPTLQPFFELNFGPKSKLLVNEFQIKCSSKEKIDSKLKKMNKTPSKKLEDIGQICPNPTKVRITGCQSYPDESVILLYEGDFSESIILERNVCGPLSRIRFALTDDNVAGYNILRIFGIEVFGEFAL